MMPLGGGREGLRKGYDTWKERILVETTDRLVSSLFHHCGDISTTDISTHPRYHSKEWYIRADGMGAC